MRTVVVTGAASGIGRQLVLDLIIKDGDRVIPVDRDESGLQSLRSELIKLGKVDDNWPVYHCDITDQKAIAALCRSLKKTTVDVLVNNAGIFYAGAFARMKMADFEKVVSVNLLGTVRFTHALLPALSRCSNPVIVNVSSLAGLIGAPGMVAYSTAKFALIGFSEALRAELGKKFAVCMVCPTFVKSNIATNALTSDEVNPESRSSWVGLMNNVLEKVGCDAAKASKAIRNAITRRRKLTLINPDAHILFQLKRFFPGACDFVVGTAFGGLKKRGVVES